MTAPADGLGSEPDPELLDCRGLLCPAPVIALARRITGIPVGGLLAVAADDVAARHDVPAWCRMRGQQFVGERTAPDGVPIYVIRRIT
ncbi:sulfurtransferase TusA family protein [Nocardioides sp. BP30]|uniref:sulfurtransferase TusA family protein n=1 Tax=Nocardioides sp. BP30 TaxID=3036374 RepID=UPI0024683E5A|nr:sulfurtransferase TusA family protein [Nocardioides sp. BP30]WGL53785.1 sulfurtransferase TusA family protein [Nocardioides sp. BP30]